MTAAGKPAIFVPFPRAADDHQKRNAEALERAGAAVMLEESNLDRESCSWRQLTRCSAIQHGWNKWATQRASCRIQMQREKSRTWQARPAGSQEQLSEQIAA